jgi:hypothetical protein
MARAWDVILRQALPIVASYPYSITLRQLHYRLVSDPNVEYRNTLSDYTILSRTSAVARRDGWFPALLDQTREIHRAPSWASPLAAMASLARQYRRDRTKDQPNYVVLGGEKATLLAQLRAWFGDLGVPFVLLRGYSSQTYVDDVADMVLEDGRPAVLIYAGDFDPSGEDILRDFRERCDVFGAVEHIAVAPSQIAQFSLVPNPGKVKDTRAKGFTERHGALIQVEVEAINPSDLQTLYQDALDQWWDQEAYEAVRVLEEDDRKRLVSAAKRIPPR